jgi:hypothetical protein
VNPYIKETPKSDFRFGEEGRYSYKEIRTLLEQRPRCYCGRMLANGFIIERIDPEGSYLIENLRLVCSAHIRVKTHRRKIS